MARVYRSAVIGSPADKVWQAIRDFHDISWAPGVLTDCVAVGDRKGDQVGARRILNDAFHETLLALDDLERSFKYQVDEAPPPVSSREVSDFVAVVRVHPITDGGQTFVEWCGNLETTSEAACEFAGHIYSALLGALQKSQS